MLDIPAAFLNSNMPLRRRRRMGSIAGIASARRCVLEEIPGAKLSMSLMNVDFAGTRPPQKQGGQRSSRRTNGKAGRTNDPRNRTARDAQRIPHSTELPALRDLLIYTKSGRPPVQARAIPAPFPLFDFCGRRCSCSKLNYLFSIDGTGVFLAESRPEAPGTLYAMRPDRTFRGFADLSSRSRARPQRTSRWERLNRYCGVCGTPMEHSRIERAFICPALRKHGLSEDLTCRDRRRPDGDRPRWRGTSTIRTRNATSSPVSWT